MKRINLPPQAYTKDTLARAYVWLKYQSASIQELAGDADTLVSLYLQSLRSLNKKIDLKKSSNSSTSLPTSAQNFEQDLKNLARGLEEFEEKNPPVNSSSSGVDVSALLAQEKLTRKSMQNQQNQLPPTAPMKTNTPNLNLDNKSQEILDQVKKSLNLSSDMEALRMLLTLGYEKIKEILPQ